MSAIVPDPATTDWVPLWSLGPAVTYGTTLPASPTDGQEHILVDSVTNPTYQWRFRYNAGSTSAYKWEFIGGSPVVVTVATGENVTSAAWVNLATNGPLFTVPRAGDYSVLSAKAQMLHSTAGGYAQLGVGVGDFSSAADSCLVYIPTANYQATLVVAPVRINALNASDVIKARYGTNTATGTISNRNIAVQPIRVS